MYMFQLSSSFFSTFAGKSGFVTQNVDYCVMNIKEENDEIWKRAILEFSDFGQLNCQISAEKIEMPVILCVKYRYILAPVFYLQ